MPIRSPWYIFYCITLIYKHYTYQVCKELKTRTAYSIIIHQTVQKDLNTRERIEIVFHFKIYFYDLFIAILSKQITFLKTLKLSFEIKMFLDSFLSKKGIFLFISYPPILLHVLSTTFYQFVVR